MKNMKKINPSELKDSAIDLIGKEWMLISAGDESNFNTMTASWGAIGFYTNQPTVTIFVRPERYTYEFIENSDKFTLTFLGEGYRDELMTLGRKSGRDCDKIALSGLTTTFTENGNPTFKEGRIVLECRKIYGQMMAEDNFVDQENYEKWYGGEHGGLHKMYIGVIENCWIKE